jgi:DNA recombination protein RmuC
METIQLIAVVLVLILGVLIYLKLAAQDSEKQFTEYRDLLQKELKENRTELTSALKDNRTELSDGLLKMSKNIEDKLTVINEGLTKGGKENREELTKNLKNFQDVFTENVKQFNDLQKQKFDAMGVKQDELVKSTETRLEKMRETVDEKLQKTLNERLTQSFEQVGKQLESVQKGLGSMQTLATDVGGLKKVLSNVKMRGTLGEVQLAMLLENILAPTQYEANVKTKASSNDIVEFAIKLPGKDDSLEQVWLPVDAKFPKDVYQKLQDAHDLGDLIGIDVAQKELENAIKKEAKNISEKYIDPPYTTDFAIMFLPFEGIYAEVVRKADLLEYLQKNHRVIVAGPTTFAAILNSLQMGFKTLTIQKYSSEIQRTLGAVKTEFDKFGGLLSKAHKNIQTGMKQLDDVIITRTNAINRKLKGVESLTDEESSKIFPELIDSKSLGTEEGSEG